MSALLAAQSQSTETTSSTSADTTASTSRSNALKDLFKLLDGDGDGKISKAEFEDKLGAGGTNTANADSVFAKLDTDGDGSVNLDELSAVAKGRKATASYNDAEQLIQRRTARPAAATTLSTSAPMRDGSSTTSLTYRGRLQGDDDVGGDGALAARPRRTISSSS